MHSYHFLIIIYVNVLKKINDYNWNMMKSNQLSEKYSDCLCNDKIIRPHRSSKGLLLAQFSVRNTNCAESKITKDGIYSFAICDQVHDPQNMNNSQSLSLCQQWCLLTRIINVNVMT